MPITLTTPISIGTVDSIRCSGFEVRGLYDTANASITVHLQLMVGAAVYQDRTVAIRNSSALPDWQGGEAKAAVSNYATALFNVIAGAVGNPKDEIENYLVANGIVPGTAS